MPFFSVIMPSYLGLYENSAAHREVKLNRAIKSVLRQSFTDFELIIISDGCVKTATVWDKFEDSRLVKIYAEKKPGITTVGTVRNIGLEQAKGKHVVYLDSDDMFGENHLQAIYDQISEDTTYSGSYFFDDCTFDKLSDSFKPRKCVLRLGKCGTSNVCHPNLSDIRWHPVSPYGYDDWRFVNTLKIRTGLKQIDCPEYFVCHIPKVYDV